MINQVYVIARSVLLSFLPPQVERDMMDALAIGTTARQILDAATAACGGKRTLCVLGIEEWLGADQLGRFPGEEGYSHLQAHVD